MPLGAPQYHLAHFIWILTISIRSAGFRSDQLAGLCGGLKYEIVTIQMYLGAQPKVVCGA